MRINFKKVLNLTQNNDNWIFSINQFLHVQMIKRILQILGPKTTVKTICEYLEKLIVDTQSLRERLLAHEDELMSGE